MKSGLRDFKVVKQELADVIGQFIVSADAIGLDSESANLKEASQRVLDNRFRVLFIGDFKRGKSTTLNALLGEKILPADMKPCTGGITVIRYAKEPSAEAEFWDEKRPPQRMTIEEFKNAVVIPAELLRPADGKEGDTRQSALDQIPYRQISLYTTASLCRDGVELVDSPGLDEDKRRTELTQSFVPKSDCAVFLLSAIQLLNQGERDNIKSLRVQGLQSMFFVVNFWDMVQNHDEPEKQAKDLKERIRQYLPGEAHVYYVSAQDALRGKTAKDAARLEASGFPKFEQALISFLAQDRAVITLRRCEATVDNAARHITEAIVQRRRLAQDSLEQVQRAYEEAQPRLAKAREALERITAEFIEGGTITAGQAQKAFAGFCDRLIRELETEGRSWEAEGYAAQEIARNLQKRAQRFVRIRFEEWSADQLHSLLLEGVKKASEAANELALAIGTDLLAIRQGVRGGDAALAQFTQQVQVNLAASLGFGVDDFAYVQAPTSGVANVGYVEPWSRTKQAVLETGGFFATATSGAVIGTLICPGIGTFLGWVIGGCAGAATVGVLHDDAIRQAQSQVVAEAVPDVRAISAAIIAEASNGIQKMQTQQLPEVQAKVNAVFGEYASRYAAVLSSDIQNTESQIAAILKAKKEKTLEVEPELKRLDELDGKIQTAKASAERLVRFYTQAEG